VRVRGGGAGKGAIGRRGLHQLWREQLALPGCPRLYRSRHRHVGSCQWEAHCKTLPLQGVKRTLVAQSQKLTLLVWRAQISYQLSLWSAFRGIATKCYKRHVQPHRCSPSAPHSTRHWAPPKVRATAVQIAAHLSSAATASGLTSEERSPGSWPSSAARTTRRIIFMLRVFGRSAMSTIAFGRNG